MPQHSSLHPYQEKGRDFLAEETFARLLADEPGLGKTIQAIRAADKAGHLGILVICPAIARTHWVSEFQREQHVKRRVTALIPPMSRDDMQNLMSTKEVLIVAYDTLSGKNGDTFVAALQTRTWDLLICDEAHRLKSSGSKRTQAVYGKGCKRGQGGLIDNVCNVWLLTGTPAPNHAGELWTHLHALFPETIMRTDRPAHLSEYEFTEAYCTTTENKWGRHITGSKNRIELRQRIKPIFLRRKKRDVLKDLPPLSFHVEPVGLTDLTYDTNQYQSVQDTTTAMWDDLSPERRLNAEEVLDWMKQRETGLSTVRLHLGLMKVRAASEYVRNELEGNNRKLLVFGWHTEVLGQIYENLREFNPVLITGKTTSKNDEQAQRKFQDDPACRVFIGQIKACGEAITLTAASDVVFVEASWVPSENYQAACRAHRIGTTSPVVARFLSVHGTLDTAVNRALARKARELAEIFA